MFRGMARVPFAVVAAFAWLVLGCSSSSRPLQFVGGDDLVYPAQAKADGIEGLVVVGYDVTEEGRVVNAVVRLAEPPGVFDEAALATVRSWRFRPQVERDRAVAAPNRVSEIRFRLGDDGRYDRLPSPQRP